MRTQSTPRRLRLVAFSFSLLGLLACGDDSTTDGSGGGTTATTTASSSSSASASTTGSGGAGGTTTVGVGGTGGTGGTGGGVPACDPVTEEGCADGLVCEEVEGGDPGCFAPVQVTGRVFDYFTDESLEGARVVARDVNGAAVSTVAVSAVDGTYTLPVPAPRDADGNIVADPITLRADASGYESFPLPPRQALPIELDTAVAGGPGEPAIVQNAATDVGLIALASTDGLGSISGTVDMSPLATPLSAAGTLVVAGGSTGIADTNGEFIVFNVPEGTWMVDGYLAGVNLDGEEAQVTAGADTGGVVLLATEDPTVTVSGSVQIVNGNGFNTTSVILALEDTFNEAFVRFDAPPGLRAGDVSGAFAIEGVPDGRYVVLAAFENDGLVRDPDTSIGGTEIVHIEVAGANVDIAQGFKVTGALAVLSPGAETIEITTATPTFVFEDDSSEDFYDVFVRDAFGALVWQTVALDPGGNADIVVPYEGPALTPGVLYQFKATSIKDGTPISTTEDLRGVFQVEGGGGTGGSGAGGGSSSSASSGGGAGGASSSSSSSAGGASSSSSG